MQLLHSLLSYPVYSSRGLLYAYYYYPIILIIYLYFLCVVAFILQSYSVCFTPPFFSVLRWVSPPYCSWLCSITICIQHAHTDYCTYPLYIMFIYMCACVFALPADLVALVKR
jgi:hypothetical protein